MSLLRFTFGLSRETKKARQLMGEWKDRGKSLRRHIAYTVAYNAQQEMMERIPKGEDWAAYRSSLQLVEVAGLGDADSFALRANPRSRTVRSVDAPDTLLYIRSRPRLRRASLRVQILEKYNPWTLQTLPFTPDRSEAKIISRKVTPREVQQVQRRRIRDQIKWRRELIAAGVRVPVVRPEKRKMPKTTPDVAHEAFRLEFGIGRKPEPHWRPTMQLVMRQGVRDLKRDPKIRNSMIRPSFTLWKSWGKIRAKTKIRVSEARSFMPFQRKLGIRVPK
jgi:hypothetical protein